VLTADESLERTSFRNAPTEDAETTQCQLQRIPDAGRRRQPGMLGCLPNVMSRWCSRECEPAASLRTHASANGRDWKSSVSRFKNRGWIGSKNLFIMGLLHSFQSTPN